MKLKFYLLMLAFGFICISACAFKFRTASELPPQLHQLYVQTEEPYGRFETMLKSSLRSSGIVLVDSPRQTNFILHISRPALTYVAATLGTSNQSRVYSVVYGVSYSILNAEEVELSKPQRLVSTRSLILSGNQLIETNNQLSLLEQEMQRDVLNQLFNALGSVKLREILQAPPPTEKIS